MCSEWSEIEMDLLIHGACIHGVSSMQSWLNISLEFLPQRDFTEIRLRLSQMLGTAHLGQFEKHIFKYKWQFEEIRGRNLVKDNEFVCIVNGVRISSFDP